MPGTQDKDQFLFNSFVGIGIAGNISESISKMSVSKGTFECKCSFVGSGRPEYGEGAHTLKFLATIFDERFENLCCVRFFSAHVISSHGPPRHDIADVYSHASIFSGEPGMLPSDCRVLLMSDGADWRVGISITPQLED